MSHFIPTAPEQAHSLSERLADVLTVTSALIGGVLVLLTFASAF